MIMNIAVVAVAVTELLVTSGEARGRFAIYCFGTVLKLAVSENVSVSALQGLGLVLVLWQKSDVSVS